MSSRTQKGEDSVDFKTKGSCCQQPMTLFSNAELIAAEAAGELPD